MTKPFELKEETERLILVGVQEQAGDDTEDSVCELGDLVRTAGGEAVGSVIQRREKIHPGTYVGTGKIEEPVSYNTSDAADEEDSRRHGWGPVNKKKERQV